MSERCNLHPEQEQIVGRLLKFVLNPSTSSENPGFAPSTALPRTAAVVGPRGIGKSTVLAAVSRDLGQEMDAQKRRLIPLPILDAAMVHDDLGLAAATIRSLYRTIEGKAVPAVSGDRSHELRTSLKGRFERCIETALLQEESHRRLAQELAMTPGHYGKIVSAAYDRKASIGVEFKQFLDDLVDVHCAVSRLQQPPVFVVLVDDLDLGPPHAVSHWIRSLLTDYFDDRICWILAFHREPLTQILSRPAAGDPGNGAALANGQALLSKAVPASRQWELLRWPAKDRREFRPLPNGSAPPGRAQPDEFGGLLTKAGRSDLLMLLPAYPRALEGEYVRLQLDLDALRLPSAEEMLRRIALASGETELVRRLDERGAVLLGSSFTWKAEETGDADWRGLVEAARTDNPLWGLPLPKDFERLVTGPDPEAYVETLLDIALADGRLTPYQLLQRLPFADLRGQDARLAGAHSQLRVPEPAVLRYFSPEGRSATQLVSTALGWQRWHEEADKDRFWTFDLGPALFWAYCLDQRTASPESLYKTLSLGRIPMTQRPAPPPPFLPCRLRPLLLLVDGLRKAAWQALETARNFWRPLTFTRCAAAFTLAGYHHHLGSGKEEERPKLLRLTDRKASRELLALSEDEVEKELRCLLEWLGGEPLQASVKAPDSPYTLAAAELRRSLAAFLQLPGVVRLVPGSPG